MKIILSAAGIFLLTFCLGFLQGRDFGSSDGALLLSCFDRIVVQLVTVDTDDWQGETLEVELRPHLIYRVGGIDVVRYDTVARAIVDVSSTAKLKMVRASIAQPLQPVEKATVVMLLGGPSAGLTFQSAVKNKKPLAIVVAALAGISGYTLGYKAGASAPLRPDSPNMLRFLGEEKNWNPIMTQAFVSLMEQARKTITEIEDSSRRDLYAHLYNRNLDHFEAKSPGAWRGIAIAHLICRQGNRSSTEVAVTAQSEGPLWLEWWWLSFVTLFTLIAAVVGSLLRGIDPSWGENDADRSGSPTTPERDFSFLDRIPTRPPAGLVKPSAEEIARFAGRR